MQLDKAWIGTFVVEERANRNLCPGIVASTPKRLTLCTVDADYVNMKEEEW